MHSWEWERIEKRRRKALRAVCYWTLKHTAARIEEEPEEAGEAPFRPASVICQDVRELEATAEVVRRLQLDTVDPDAMEPITRRRALKMLGHLLGVEL